MTATHRMPAELPPHDRCWMAWPCRAGMWSKSVGTQQRYADVAHAIRRFEPVTLLVPPSLRAEAKKYLSSDIEIFDVPIIAPAYGIALDDQDKERLQSCFPDRGIVQLRIDHIAEGGGGIHCITQQQPTVMTH